LVAAVDAIVDKTPDPHLSPQADDLLHLAVTGVMRLDRFINLIVPLPYRLSAAAAAPMAGGTDGIRAVLAFCQALLVVAHRYAVVNGLISQH
jgi:hypothetical protein